MGRYQVPARKLEEDALHNSAEGKEDEPEGEKEVGPAMASRTQGESQAPQGIERTNSHDAHRALEGGLADIEEGFWDLQHAFLTFHRVLSDRQVRLDYGVLETLSYVFEAYPDILSTPRSSGGSPSTRDRGEPKSRPSM